MGKYTLNKRSAIILGIALSSFISTTAMADETSNSRLNGLYVGGGFGKTKMNFKTSVGNATMDQSDNATSSHFFVGIETPNSMGENIGFELGYTDLGKLQAQGTLLTSSVNVSAKIKSYYIATTGTSKLSDKIDLFGKLGLSYNKASYTISSDTVNNLSSGSSNKSSVFGGLGVRYNFTQHVGAELAYNYYGKVSSGNTSFKAHNFGVNARYSF